MFTRLLLLTFLERSNIIYLVLLSVRLFVYQDTTSVPKVALYNITADPTEHEDLSEKLPEVVKALQERVQYYMKGAVPPLNKTPDPKAFLKAKSEGVWTPWQD